VSLLSSPCTRFPARAGSASVTFAGSSGSQGRRVVEPDRPPARRARGSLAIPAPSGSSVVTDRDLRGPPTSNGRRLIMSPQCRPPDLGVAFDALVPQWSARGAVAPRSRLIWDSRSPLRRIAPIRRPLPAPTRTPPPSVPGCHTQDPVPPSWSRTTSTVCSVRSAAGLLHPASGPGVRRVFRLPEPDRTSRSAEPGRRPRDASTLRRIPLTCSRSPSPGPWPSCRYRSSAARVPDDPQVAVRIGQAPKGRSSPVFPLSEVPVREPAGHAPMDSTRRSSGPEANPGPPTSTCIAVRAGTPPKRPSRSLDRGITTFVRRDAGSEVQETARPPTSPCEDRP